MNRKKEIFQYFVEGEDEKRLIQVLKTDMQLIQPGKIQVLNVVNEKLTDLKLRVLNPNTILVFVFDTDTKNADILKENIRFAKQASNIKCVLCITQVRNIEDELIRCTNIERIEELLDSSSKSAFKRDFIKEKRLKDKLLNHSFDLNTLWCKSPKKPFDEIPNDSSVIKYKFP